MTSAVVAMPREPTSNGVVPGVTVAGTRIAINVSYDEQGDGPALAPNGPNQHQLDAQTATKSPESESPQESDTAKSEQYTNGPDQIIPSDEYFTSDKFGAVKLQIGSRGLSACDPISIHTLLHRSAEKFGDLPALRYKVDDVWQTINYRDYLDQVRCVARAFLKLGLEPKGGVCVLGFNSSEWFISSLAAIYAGGVSVGVYTTNNAESCRHCAEDSGCNIFVVEDAKQLEKVLQFREQLPSLRAVVQYSGQPTAEGVLSWSQLVDIGAEQDSLQLQERVKRVAINQVATMIYTSGTTGMPKGVMLSHDCLTFTARSSCAVYRFTEGEEHCVSYLPLSHIAALMSDVYVAMTCGACIWFAGKDALKGGLVNTLVEVRPTAFLGVPRVFEKIAEGCEQKFRQAKGVRRSLLLWAQNIGRQAQQARLNGSATKPLGYSVARRLVLSKIHKTLGLDRARFLLSGAAPLSKEALAFFHSLDFNMLQTYGMSESSAPHTTTWITEDLPGSVGMPLPGFRVRLYQPDVHEGGQGEVCMSGRNVFMGYRGQPEQTAQTVLVDSEGAWLRTGDLGTITGPGLLTITGRSKELIITAGGENVPPLRIEHEVLKELPIVSNCCLIGDKRKFLSLLITIKVDIDMETQEPTDHLAIASLEFCSSAGSKARTVSDILKGPDEQVMAAIQAGIDRANSRAASNAQRVQKWTIIPKDFSIPGGELGPTLKLKRPVVHKKYASVIDRIYM
uniref:long-chain-fatty-acid--CoA ligase n=1 Tax=Parasacculina yatsui TaxID=2836420 RepID=A0A8K1RCH6_9CRUS|nr:ACS-bubblegum-like protein [Parasacculina yatsui]